jgi:MoaA/NifB/PqqE/SkfB family radical SAM enzyme
MPHKTLPQNFCVAPFVQCTTHPSQSFSPCPYLGGTTWSGDHGNIRSQWHSEALQALRQDFLDNKQNPICTRCWNEEQHGKRSLRLRLWDPVKATSDYAQFNQPDWPARLQHNIETQAYLNGPQVLTIKNGNVCNARCRTCHPGDSSRWITDAGKIKSQLGREYYPVISQEQNWSDDQLEEIFQISRTLTRLELFGGEPMYNKQVHRLLDRLIDSGHSEHISLYINTNGSVDIVERFPRISEFQAVEIGVSIDGVGPQFDYIRNGVAYQDVCRQIKSLQQYFTAHGTNYSIDSISTVNILNIYYLPELKQAVQALLPLAPFWNLLIHPPWLNIKNMPDPVKASVIDKLSHDPEFQELISVMRQPADLTQWSSFLDITAVLDGTRSEDFAATFPEFHDVIRLAS